MKNWREKKHLCDDDNDHNFLFSLNFLLILAEYKFATSTLACTIKKNILWKGLYEHKQQQKHQQSAIAHNTLKCNLLELCIGIKILLQAICLGEFSRVYTQQKKNRRSEKELKNEKEKALKKGFIQISNYTFYGMLCADAHNTFSSYLLI